MLPDSSMHFWEFKAKLCLCIISWWAFSFWSACIPPGQGEKAWNLADGGLWSRNVPLCPGKSAQIWPRLFKMVCRPLTVKNSNSSEYVTPWKQGLNTHFPTVTGTGYARVTLVFPAFFSGHCAPPHLLLLKHWRRGICEGERQRPRVEKTEKQEVGRRLRETSREKIILGHWQVKENGKERNKTEETCIEGWCPGAVSAAVLGGDPQTLGTTTLLLPAIVCKTCWTDIVSLAAQALGGCNNLLCFLSDLRGVDGRVRSPPPCWPVWTEGALPFLFVPFLSGWWVQKHKVKHFSARKRCKHSCWATIGPNLN